ncbi:MAG: adenylate/guanylate cyclase domain-containing protein [Candidatus Coatesbacteria bacterium]|nr:adenylate/guanylate cyclase domain-containing protein [Candidatus Coatesbacteria bacterium]
MKALPGPVREYIYGLTTDAVKKRSPAYMLVDREGALIEFGGELAVYGLSGLRTGIVVEDQADYLTGLLPLDDEPIFLTCVKGEKDISMDVHLFPGERGDWVLLLDARELDSSRYEAQQKSHELSLSEERQSRLLNQFMGQEIVESIQMGKLQIKDEGERRLLTILFADIRDFTTFSENQHPQVVFRTLNLYLHEMMEPILNEGSALNAIIGDEVMAVFGILTASASHAFRAVKAALSMMQSVERLRTQRKARLLPPLGIGIGIATGPVALGMLGTRQRSAITVIGHHVNLASRLQNLASRGEILIDENSYNSIRSLKRFFRPTAHRCKGMAALVRTYSSLLED